MDTARDRRSVWRADIAYTYAFTYPYAYTYAHTQCADGEHSVASFGTNRRRHFNNDHGYRIRCRCDGFNRWNRRVQRRGG